MRSVCLLIIGSTDLAVVSSETVNRPSDCAASRSKVGEFRDDILRQHNIYRCMHDVAPLQWSEILADESQSWADCKKDHFEPGQVCDSKKTCGGFYPAPLEQNQIPLALEAHMDIGQGLVEGINLWYEVLKRQNLLSETATHVGCGYWQTEVDGSQLETSFVCNYGPGRVSSTNVQGTFGKDKLAVRSEEDCAKEVDILMKNAPDPRTDTPVIIQYEYPKPGLAVSQQTADEGGCPNDKDGAAQTPAAYRLILKDKLLSLVAVTEKGDSCAAGFTKDDVRIYGKFHRWNTGLFVQGPDGDHTSLLVDSEMHLSPNSDDGLYSIDVNDFGGVQPFWRFRSQDSEFPHWMCVINVPDADGRFSVSLGSHKEVGKTMDQGCSDKWTTATFPDPYPETELSNPHQQTIFSGKPKTCSDCRKNGGLGGKFLCAVDEACMLTPTSLECTAMGGEWCGAGPAPSPKPCIGGADDWRALPAGQSRLDCAGGCSYSVCEQKMRMHPKQAWGHCYTKWGHGCYMGSRENTCAYDEHGICTYSVFAHLDSVMTV